MSLSNLLIIFSSSFMALFPVVNPLGNGFVVNGFFTLTWIPSSGKPPSGN